jgi:hypothetical protein
MKPNKSIFLITCIDTRINIDKIRVGFFFNLEEAKKVVENNELDIAEGKTNNYIVIEEYNEGIYTASKEIQWYKLNKETEKYIECEKPITLSCIFNFGII